MEGASFVTISFISCMRCLNIEGQTHHLMIKPQIMPPTDNLCLKSSPVHKARKFSAVFGTTSPKRPITILPTSSPPTSTSKKHLVVTFACRSTSWYNRVMRTQDPNTYVVPKMEGATYAYFKKKKIIIIITVMKTLTESHICLYELHNHLKVFWDNKYIELIEHHHRLKTELKVKLKPFNFGLL